MKLTPAQYKALKSAIDHGNPTRHLSGMYDWGGWGGTRAALQRKGFLDTACQITDAGREVMRQFYPETQS